MRIRIFQNCYRLEQLADCTFEPHLNALPSTPDEYYLFLESQVIRDLVQKNCHAGCDWFGVVSARWQAKLEEARSWGLPIRNQSLGAVTREGLWRLAAANADADFLSLARFIPHAVFPAGEERHPGLMEATGRLLEQIGVRFDLRRCVPHPIYFNFFIAKPSAIEAYVHDMLAPAIEVATQDKLLRPLLFRNATYFRPITDDLRNLYGLSDYTLHPFVGERLINIHTLLTGSRVASFEMSEEEHLSARAMASLKFQASAARWRVRQWRRRGCGDG